MQVFSAPGSIRDEVDVPSSSTGGSESVSESGSGAAGPEAAPVEDSSQSSLRRRPRPRSHAKHTYAPAWTKLYDAKHGPSADVLRELKLSRPIRVGPGKTVGVYVHSTARGDQSIVYNDQRSTVTLEDMHFRILPGFAHVSNKPFSPSCAWGYAWRDRREFVGRIRYAVKWKLWKPATHSIFPAGFKAMVRTMLACQQRTSSPLSRVPRDLILYIINFCAWDWQGVPEELKMGIVGNSSSSTAYVRAMRERELRLATELFEAGQRAQEEERYSDSTQKYAEALSHLRGSVTGQRLALSANLYSRLAFCCLHIAEGRDAEVEENLRSLSEMYRPVARRALRRQCLEQAVGYGTRALDKMELCPSKDTKTLLGTHVTVATACTFLGSEGSQPCYHLRKAQRHWQDCLKVDETHTPALTGMEKTNAVIEECKRRRREAGLPVDCKETECSGSDTSDSGDEEPEENP